MVCYDFICEQMYARKYMYDKQTDLNGVAIRKSEYDSLRLVAGTNVSGLLPH